MLLDEQASELLKRCEEIVGTTLSQVRGNLGKAESRAAAVWELLVLEAVSHIGQVEYEPLPGGSPDIRLLLPGNRVIWIEVAFLYPRFWKEERESIAVTNWLFSEAKRRGIPSYKIIPRLDGVNKKNAGPVRKLPKLNEQKHFLMSQEIICFFDEITEKPNIPHGFTSSNYTISITYSPNAQSHGRTSGGLVQEAPTVVEEHAVYRMLKEKAKQHAVSGPRIICIGSDQSSALSRIRGPQEVRLEDAINVIFLKNQSLSATIMVSIENIPTTFVGIKKQARVELFTNRYGKAPLLPEEIQLIKKLDFNRWKYSFPLPNWKNQGGDQFNSVTGTLAWKFSGLGIQVEIPANIIIDALAGKTTIDKAFGLKKEESLYQAFNEGWKVESCSFKKGNIEQGEAPKVVLELSPPFTVFERNNKTLNPKKED